MRHVFWGTVAAITIAAGVYAQGQTTGRPNPPLVNPSVAGQDLFAVYCASCHGRDGAGHGPVAAALKTPPPDLRLIARRYHGEFPRQRVEDFVTNDGGAPTPAHGTTEMPVWGPVFKGLDPSDTMTKIRIENVVKYLESIQVK
jgi:mono/diheme cytochrome c family protein